MLTPSYGITAFPDLLSSEPTVPFNTIYPNPLGSTYNIGKILAFMGVKHVVYHDDSTNYPSDQILQELLLPGRRTNLYAREPYWRRRGWFSSRVRVALAES